jgi:2-C-methyl-D-erythritol 2,4-cyclodiphosphate synthase
VDAIIIAEEPKLNPFVSSMKGILCPILGLRPQDFSIKAKTQEGMGDIGSGRAMAAWAVATLETGA